MYFRAHACPPDFSVTIIMPSRGVRFIETRKGTTHREGEDDSGGIDDSTFSCPSDCREVVGNP